MLFFSLGWEGTHSSAGGDHAAGHSFSYFTILTFWGLAFYFLTAAIHTFGFVRTGSPLLDRFPRPLQALYSLYYTTITTYPFIVTLIFWGAIYDGSWFPLKFDAWTNISEHAMNSSFALFEILVTRTEPPPFIHAVWLIIILALYLGVAYITNATEGWFVYSFLNPDNGPILAGYIVGIAAGAIIAFSIVNLIIRGRKWLTEVKLKRTGIFGAGRRNLEPAIELEDRLAGSEIIEK